MDEIFLIIFRVLDNTASDSDMEKLDKWLSVSKSNSSYFLDIKNVWDVSSDEADPGKIDTQEALKKVYSRVQKKSYMGIFWTYWQRAAAVVLIPLLIGGGLFLLDRSPESQNKSATVYNEITVPFSTRSYMVLPDSTKVWLNAGSVFRYPVVFDGSDRTVFLEGEAYFEVKSDSVHPFIVKTNLVQVRSTGTKFNVNEYGSEEKTMVTLIEGRISVQEGNFSSDLKIGEHFEYDKDTKNRNITSADPYKYIAWKDGKLIFRHEPLIDVINRIALIFNVDIDIQGEIPRDYMYRATFQDESLEEILKLLKLSSPIDYMEVKRHPMPDGTFPKKRIIIYPSKNR
jgi:transmembrane sensor